MYSPNIYQTRPYNVERMTELHIAHTLTKLADENI